MGNQQVKRGEQHPFTPEELKILESSFRQTSGGHTEKLAENRLLVSIPLQNRYIFVIQCNKTQKTTFEKNARSVILKKITVFIVYFG